jgi:hypothetical protein
MIDCYYIYRLLFKDKWPPVYTKHHTSQMLRMFHVYSEPFHLTYMEPVLTFWHRSFTFNSNKSLTWCNNFSVYYPEVCLQLNMFWAFSRPSSGAEWLQQQPLVLPSYCGDSRVVFVVGPAGPTTNTARLSPRYEGKTRGRCCSHAAPDDGQENSRNMLSCKKTSG